VTTGVSSVYGREVGCEFPGPRVLWYLLYRGHGIYVEEGYKICVGEDHNQYLRKNCVSGQVYTQSHCVSSLGKHIVMSVLGFFGIPG
jgi:hypothetical protein